MGVSEPRKNALLTAGQPVPSTVIARLLVDTGASGTNIDQTIIQKLQLQPRGSVPVNTPSTGATPHVASVYDVSLAIRIGQMVRGFSATPVISSNFAAQNIDGLLGRDVLAHALFHYDGQSKSFTFAI